MKIIDKEQKVAFEEYLAMIAGRCYGPALKANKELQSQVQRDYDQSPARDPEGRAQLAKQLADLVIEELVLDRKVESMKE